MYELSIKLQFHVALIQKKRKENESKRDNSTVF